MHEHDGVFRDVLICEGRPFERPKIREKDGGWSNPCNEFEYSVPRFVELREA